MKYSPYSFSKISEFNQCPKKFKLHYIDKIRIKAESLALDKGKYYHKSLEENMLYDAFPGKFKSKFCTEETLQEDEIQDKISEILKSKRYQSLKGIFKNSEFSEVEAGIGFSVEDGELTPVYYEESTLFRGFIDVFMIKNKKGVTLDYKSGNYKKFIYQDWSQGEFYALWLHLKYNIDEVLIVFYYVEHDKSNSRKYTKKDFEKIKVKFKSNLAKIEATNQFNKRVTKLCPYCQYFNNECTLTDSELLTIL